MIAAKESLLDLCRLMDSDRSGSLPSCDEGSGLRVQDLRFSGFMGLGFGAPRVSGNPGAVLHDTELDASFPSYGNLCIVNMARSISKEPCWRMPNRYAKANS